MINIADVKSEVESIKRQLLKKYKPEKIILFGSYAKGEFGQNSDLDFLIVKNDSRRAIEIEQELHRIIDYRLASDFLFLSADEFRKRLDEGDFFLKEIMTTGKIRYE